VPFPATWNSQPVMVRAVLERTVVVYPADRPSEPDDRGWSGGRMWSWILAS
jgi:hypothetical protein